MKAPKLFLYVYALVLIIANLIIRLKSHYARFEKFKLVKTKTICFPPLPRTNICVEKE